MPVLDLTHRLGQTPKVLIAAIALTIAAPGASGQATRTPSSVLEQQQARERMVAETGPKIDLDFAGGTVAEYVERIREAAPEFANIVLLPGAEDWPAPAVQLRQVAVGAAVSVLDGLVADHGNRSLLVDTRGFPVLRIMVLDEARRMGLSRTTRVWSVSGLLNERATADEVLAAVQVGQSLFGAEAAQMKFHEPTGLLVARGSAEQLELIAMTLKQLETSPRPVDRVAELEAALQTAQRDQQRAREKLSNAHARANIVKRQIDQIRAMASAGADAPDPNEKRLEAIRLDEEVSDRSFELDEINEKVADIERLLEEARESRNHSE